DIKNGLGAFIPTPDVRQWRSIEKLKIKYELDGKYSELPYLTIYPPTIPAAVGTKTIKVAGRGKFTSKQSGEISIESDPKGVAFEVTSLELTKSVAGKENTIKINTEALGAFRFANNGKIDIKFNLGTDLNDDKATFKGIVNAKIIGTGEVLSTPRTDIVFVDEIPLTIWNRPSNYSISINDKAEIEDPDINTSGKGDLGIMFATKEYADVIKVERSNVGSNYSFKLSGLGQLPEKSFSYFYYTDKGEKISPPYLIVKEAPVLTNFKFNGVDKDKLVMEFGLPAFVDQSLIAVNVINSNNKDLMVGGTMLVEKKPGSKGDANFVINLPNNITETLSKDTIKDLRFNIIYNSITVYSINVKYFNQRLLNDRIAALAAETSVKPGKRDKVEIEKIVKAIVQIGEAVGNSVDDPEVSTAIAGLENGDKDKVKSVMSDIGKWALIAGKVVLPLLI
ncbi:MAG: hypothetical protein RIC15_00055, partial [Vicingaceae bacterium]